MHAAVAYWVNAAREQHRSYVAIRTEARRTRSCRESGRLYDAARRCQVRVPCLMAEARRMRAEVRRVSGGAA